MQNGTKNAVGKIGVGIASPLESHFFQKTPTSMLRQVIRSLNEHN